MRRIPFLAVVILCLTSPALAGTESPWGPWTPWNPWMKAWACSAYEYAKKCNAQLRPRSERCECVPDGGHLGWRLNVYYGPGARNLAPRDGEP